MTASTTADSTAFPYFPFVTDTAVSSISSSSVFITPDMTAFDELSRPASRNAPVPRPIRYYPQKPENFTTILYSILEGEQYWCLHWNEDGTEVVIESPESVATDVLPHHFGTTKYQSFTRQFHLYGFRRSTDGRKERTLRGRCRFRHPCFLRDHPHLLQKVTRVKVQRKASSNTEASTPGNKGKRTVESPPLPPIKTSITQSPGGSASPYSAGYYHAQFKRQQQGVVDPAARSALEAMQALIDHVDTLDYSALVAVRSYAGQLSCAVDNVMATYSTMEGAQTAGYLAPPMRPSFLPRSVVPSSTGRQGLGIMGEGSTKHLGAMSFPGGLYTEATAAAVAAAATPPDSMRKGSSPSAVGYSHDVVAAVAAAAASVQGIGYPQTVVAPQTEMNSQIAMAPFYVGTEGARVVGSEGMAQFPIQSTLNAAFAGVVQPATTSVVDPTVYLSDGSV